MSVGESLSEQVLFYFNIYTKCLGVWHLKLHGFRTKNSSLIVFFSFVALGFSDATLTLEMFNRLNPAAFCPNYNKGNVYTIIQHGVFTTSSSISLCNTYTLTHCLQR